MKVLFIAILDKNECEQELFSRLMQKGYNGTLIPTTSIKHALLGSGVEPVPIFAGLRHVVETTENANSTLFIVIDLDSMEEVKSIINDVTDNLAHHAGMMFAVPLIMFEGEIK